MNVGVVVKVSVSVRLLVCRFQLLFGVSMLGHFSGFANKFTRRCSSSGLPEINLGVGMVMELIDKYGREKFACSNCRIDYVKIEVFFFLGHISIPESLDASVCGWNELPATMWKIRVHNKDVDKLIGFSIMTFCSDL